jgi:hypothetical protein
MKRTTGTVVTKFLKERLKTEYMNSTNTRGELIGSGRVSKSCSTSCTDHVPLVNNPGISHECVREGFLIMLYGAYPTDGDRKTFESITST